WRTDRHPSLQTGRAVLPHPAFQSVSSRQGLKPFRLSCLKAEQPLLCKPWNWILIAFSRMHHPFALVSSAQNVAYAFSGPFVHPLHGRGLAPFEVVIPAPQRTIDLRTDLANAASSVPPQFGSQALSQFELTLLSRPLLAPVGAILFEVVAQKVEASSLCRIDYPRLARVQLQSCLPNPLGDLLQRFYRLCFRPGADHEVICIAHHLPSLLGHLMVQRVEVYVR